MQGKTNLKQLLKSDKPLCILQIKEADLKKFNSEAKKYGVLFTAVSDRANDTGLCDIIAKQEDVTKLNYIVEKLGCAVPKKEQPEQKQEGGDIKKQNPRARSEHRYTKRGDMEIADRNIKSSVRDKITQIKAERSIGKMILSIIVGTFSSNIHTLMRSYLRNYSIAGVRGKRCVSNI